MKLEIVLDSITNRSVKKFFKYILTELEKLDIKLCLDANLSKIGAKTAGYYCNFDKEIRCYVNLDDFSWLCVLCHEMSHVAQSIEGNEGSKEWRDFEELELTMEDIQIKKKLPPSLARFRRVMVALEHDADTRAIELIKKFKLPVDLIQYQKEANYILYCYVYLCRRRIWPELKNKDREGIINALPPYLLDKEMFVWSKMPPLLKAKLDELRVK
jgi:hypothetical protein